MEDIKKVKEIIVPEGTVKTLQSLTQQIQVLQGYVRMIGDTLINASNAQGNYLFASDFTKLIES